MVLANCEDTANTNITLTVREVARDVPIVAIVEEEDSIEILKLTGATTVVALKHQLGAYLANRVDAGRRQAHVVGEFRELQIAELPARDTPFLGKTVRDTETTAADGRERGRLLGARTPEAGIPGHRDSGR